MERRWAVARKNIKPVQLLLQEGISLNDMFGVFRGLNRTIRAAGVYGEVKVFSTDEHPVVMNGKIYASYFDFIHETATEASDEEGHLNADTIIDCLKLEAFQSQYTMVVVTELIYRISLKKGKRGIGGTALPGVGCVMTVADFSAVDPLVRRDAISFRAGHEPAHVFGVISEDRKKDPMVWYGDPDAGLHCLRDCAMLYGSCNRMAVRKKLLDRLFCSQCEKDLKRYFLA